MYSFDDWDLAKIFLICIFIGLTLGFFIGDHSGFNRGISMMQAADCDEEIARDIDRTISPSEY